MPLRNQTEYAIPPVTWYHVWHVLSFVLGLSMLSAFVASLAAAWHAGLERVVDRSVNISKHAAQQGTAAIGQIGAQAISSRAIPTLRRRPVAAAIDKRVARRRAWRSQAGCRVADSCSCASGGTSAADEAAEPAQRAPQARQQESAELSVTSVDSD